MSLPRLHQLLPFAQIFLLFVPLLQWLSLACVLQALLHRLPLPQGLGLLAVSNSLPFPQCFPSASRILTFPPPHTHLQRISWRSLTAPSPQCKPSDGQPSTTNGRSPLPAQCLPTSNTRTKDSLPCHFPLNTRLLLSLPSVNHLQSDFPFLYPLSYIS